MILFPVILFNPAYPGHTTYTRTQTCIYSHYLSCMLYKICLSICLALNSMHVFAQVDGYTLLKPDRVFDGEMMHTGWVVLVNKDTIVSAGPMSFKLPEGTRIIELPGSTLMPGLIEGHSHLFLHPYNETTWDDQILKESRAERIIRAVNHAKATVMAGFTTVRDLGTEGLMFDDVGLKNSINRGIIIGPRVILATRAIVAKGTYGPKSENTENDLPVGAEEVSGMESIASAVRSQIGRGADLIKVYADYSYGINREVVPAFSVDELRLMVDIAARSNRKVVAHASSAEGMRNAVLAGISTIEHGDAGTLAVFKLMKEKGVALCPTLAASDAVARYRGWKKALGADGKLMEPEPDRLVNKRKTFRLALEAGVTMLMGGDAGVFPHGDNAREMEMMVDYGMQPLAVLRSATSVNADVFGYASTIGRIKKGLLADMVAVEGDPLANIRHIRKVKMVMLGGKVL